MVSDDFFFIYYSYKYTINVTRMLILTSLAPPHFIEMPLSSEESEQ
jgi:hypothetical protein